MEQSMALKQPNISTISVDYGIPNLAETVLSSDMPIEKCHDFDEVAKEIREKYFEKISH